MYHQPAHLGREIWDFHGLVELDTSHTSKFGEGQWNSWWKQQFVGAARFFSSTGLVSTYKTPSACSPFLRIEDLVFRVFLIIIIPPWYWTTGSFPTDPKKNTSSASGELRFDVLARDANDIWGACIPLFNQWLFLVPVKGGRWHKIPQLAGKMALIYHL